MNEYSAYIEGCSGVILAGGDNSRMPVSKAFIKVEGMSIIKRTLSLMKGLFREVFIVTNQPEEYVHLDARLLGDIHDVRGPMSGIFTALMNSSHAWCFVSACDMPFIDTGLIKHMASFRKGADAVVPLSGNGAEPLFAFYATKLRTPMERYILGRKAPPTAGRPGMKDFLTDTKVKYIKGRHIREFDPRERSFINLNTPADVRNYLRVKDRKEFNRHTERIPKRRKRREPCSDSAQLN